MPKVLAVGPLEELFEATSVAAKGVGAWEAFRCRACGWIVTVADPKSIPPHECAGLRESESLYDEGVSAEPTERSAASRPEGGSEAGVRGPA